nr:zinc finger, CCHC-type, retrotransposon Gag domain protein [Tanacetum cinerariifolium]
MVDEHHPKVQKASTSKGVESPIDDVTHNDNENKSSSSSEGLNFRGFMNKETKVLNSMIRKQVGKEINNVMPFYISQTTDNLKEIIQKELAEFKRGGILNDYMNEMETYRDFTACDLPKFDGMLDPIASTMWLSAIEGDFCTSSFDKIREEFQTLTQTNETVNELKKKFNDLIRYCPEYHGNEKIKVERFQRMLCDDIREVISPFKCTTLDDLLSRARVREVDLLRKKNKETNKTKRKLEFGERDVKKPN